jgi:N-hydroxyarylamine O-acetyltransferase
MDYKAYLSRIHYTGSTEPTGAVLRVLQRSHLLAVPFENLDIHLSRPIRLDEEALFDKIVTRRRGGFCYELNGLFARLLEALGYRVLRLSASSLNDDGSYTALFDHLILQVHAPDDPETAWLVDVGWGDGPLEPLRMLEPGVQRQGGRVFQLQPDTCNLVLAEKTAQETWHPMFRFDLRAYDLEEFAPMCQYHQTSPDSIFTQKRIATLLRPDGRITLSDLRLITTRESGLRGSGMREERQLGSEDEFRVTLRGQFGIVLDETAPG